MKITAVDVFVTSPGRNFVTLKITTDAGITGLGDATLNGREMAAVGYLRDHLAPSLIGRDPQQIEDTWQFLYRGAYWRRGPVTMAAISAVDVALWDIKGKVAGLPVYQLLGGASRTGVLIYAHAYGRDVESLIEAVQRLVDDGYQAVRVQAAVPGLTKTYGVPADGVEVYEPAESDLPEAESWDTDSYLEFAPEMVREVRSHFGPRLKLLHDVHHRLTAIEAARLGKALEPYRLFWMEDPTPAEDQEAFALIRQHTVTPIAVGEVFNSIWDCQSLITRRLIDYVRAAVTHAGGITHLRRIFDLGHLYGVRTGSHGASDLSPIAFAASLHLGLAVPNFGIQEYMGHPGQAAEVFRTHYRRDGAMMHPGDAPGLGVECDEEAAARHPFRPRSLPYARLLDGTVHDW